MAGKGAIRKAGGLGRGCGSELIGNAERIPGRLPSLAGSAGKDKKNEATAISFSEACKSARK